MDKIKEIGKILSDPDKLIVLKLLSEEKLSVNEIVFKSNLEKDFVEKLIKDFKKFEFVNTHYRLLTKRYSWKNDVIIPYENTLAKKTPVNDQITDEKI